MMLVLRPRGGRNCGSDDGPKPGKIRRSKALAGDSRRVARLRRLRPVPGIYLHGELAFFPATDAAFEESRIRSSRALFLAGPGWDDACE